MSAKMEDHEEVIPATPTLNVEDEKSDKRSRWSDDKGFHSEQIAIEDSQTGRESLGVANGEKINNIHNLTNVTDNGNSKPPNFDLPIEEMEQNDGFAEELRDKQTPRISGSNDTKVDEKKKSIDYRKKLIDVINNGNSKSPNFDLSIEEIEQNDGVTEERHDEQIKQMLKVSGGNDTKLDEEKKSTDCADECKCKMQQAFGLIIEEIKKIDAVIIKLKTSGQCPYTPKPEEKKEFAKSVQKNSSVCHVIIGELKKQRVEINDMMELYEESRRDFSNMEAAVNHQREKIQQIEVMLTSVAETLKDVKYDIAERHENFQLEMKTRRIRVETREEILRVFLNWILSLDAKRYEEQEASDLRVREATEERERDRTMLTLAVRQLQEVRKIEISLMTQQTALTQRREDRLNVPIAETQQTTLPISFCGCSSPINRVAIISAPCSGATGCGKSRGRYGTALMRCAGGADGFGTPMPIATGLGGDKNIEWNTQMPFAYQQIFRGPKIYHRRVPIIRRKSPTNNSRRHRRQIKNMQNTTGVRHCI